MHWVLAIDTVRPARETGSNTRSEVMKDYKEEGLALAGMLVVLLGVMFAAAATVA